MTLAQLVVEATSHYHDLLRGRHLTSTRALLDRDPELAYCNVLRPHFIDQESYERILEVTGLLNRGIIAASDRLAHDVPLRRKLGIPEYMDAVIELDREHGLPSVMGRFDGFVDKSGHFQVIEYNSTPGLVAAEAAFASLPIASDFERAFAFRTMHLNELAFEALRVDQKRYGGGGLPVIGRPEPPGGAPRIPPWLAHVESRGCKVVVASFDDFRFDGGRLIAGAGGPVDTIVPDWNDLLPRLGSPSPIFDAIRARAVRTVHGVSRGLLSGYKHTFELLSNPEYACLFEPSVAAALAKHVPWTRALRSGKTSYGSQVVDLLSFVVESRERMVLKPSGGSAGTGVVLGSRCTEAVWTQTLKRAIRQKYVVQERVFGDVESYPARPGEGMKLEELTPTFEPFVWNGDNPMGMMSRLSSNGMHTIPDGASYPPTWIIDGTNTASAT